MIYRPEDPQDDTHRLVELSLGVVCTEICRNGVRFLETSADSTFGLSRLSVLERLLPTAMPLGPAMTMLIWSSAEDHGLAWKVLVSIM